MIGCWKAKMMLAHLLIKKSKCISVLLAVQGPLAQNVLEKAIAGVHLDALCDSYRVQRTKAMA